MWLFIDLIMFGVGSVIVCVARGNRAVRAFSALAQQEPLKSTGTSKACQCDTKFAHMETKNSRLNRAMGQVLKGARTEAGLTAAELAAHTGISVGTINRMSSEDVRDISISQIVLIAGAVDVTPQRARHTCT